MPLVLTEPQLDKLIRDISTRHVPPVTSVKGWDGRKQEREAA